ncbi:M91 family zinc metallopeptidase [Thiolapillus sp.]
MDSVLGAFNFSTPAADLSVQKSPAGASDLEQLRNMPAPAQINQLQWELSAPQERQQLLEEAGLSAHGLGKEATVTRRGTEVVIDTGAGNDRIRISQDAKTGGLAVTVNGEEAVFSPSDKLVIKAGEGNDTIWVDRDVTVRLRLEGGDGNDFIRGGSGDDVIQGGKGNDRLHGGGGDDYINGSMGRDIIYGDAGNDVIYGGRGDDLLFGNAGNDYLEGSAGADLIFGNDGNDLISGGTGNDRLYGSYGDDVLYAGEGKDRLSPGAGGNKLFLQNEDALLSSGKAATDKVITVELTGNPGGTGLAISGSDAFVERVEADVEMLRSSPRGREMLAAFDAANASDGVIVTISQISDPNGYADWANRTNPSAPQPFLHSSTGAKGTPNDVTIGYNPSFMPILQFSDGGSTELLPNVVLFHEMAHAYDMTHGTLRTEKYHGLDPSDRGISASERVAVGLPIDHDLNPGTAERTDAANHPDNLTENALRDEMNLSSRDHYAVSGVTRY